MPLPPPPPPPSPPPSSQFHRARVASPTPLYERIAAIIQEAGRPAIPWDRNESRNPPPMSPPPRPADDLPDDSLSSRAHPPTQLADPPGGQVDPTLSDNPQFRPIPSITVTSSSPPQQPGPSISPSNRALLADVLYLSPQDRERHRAQFPIPENYYSIIRGENNQNEFENNRFSQTMQQFLNNPELIRTYQRMDPSDPARASNPLSFLPDREEFFRVSEEDLDPSFRPPSDISWSDTESPNPGSEPLNQEISWILQAEPQTALYSGPRNSGRPGVPPPTASPSPPPPRVHVRTYQLNPASSGPVMPTYARNSNNEVRSAAPPPPPPPPPPRFFVSRRSAFQPAATPVAAPSPGPRRVMNPNSNNESTSRATPPLPPPPPPPRISSATPPTSASPPTPTPPSTSSSTYTSGGDTGVRYGIQLLSRHIDNMQRLCR